MLVKLDLSLSSGPFQIRAGVKTLPVDGTKLG